MKKMDIPKIVITIPPEDLKKLKANEINVDEINIDEIFKEIMEELNKMEFGEN